MSEAEQEWLDWAVLGGGTIEVPLQDACNPALLSLIAKGYLAPAGSDVTGHSLRYTLTEKHDFRSGVKCGPGRLPDGLRD